jgi:thiamine-phosphate pyrophosphorylase
MPLRLPPLYPIVDVDICRLRGLDPLTLLDAYLAGGARFIQFRDKTTRTGPLVALAEAAAARAHAAGAALIVNDRADVATLSHADGVHVGQDDLSVNEVRLVLGDEAIVGLSTHDEAQIDRAFTTSASYIAVGPIYGTSTKDTGYTARGLDLVRYAVAHSRPDTRHDEARPIVAIGGITLERAPDVLAAGAASVAIISDLLTADPAARIRAFLAAGGHSPMTRPPAPRPRNV